MILLVDADQLQARLIADNLTLIGHQVTRTQRGWDTLIAATGSQPDLIIIDCAVAKAYELVCLLRSIRKLSRTPILLIALERPSYDFMKKMGISGWIDQPLNTMVLIERIQSLLPLTNIQSET